MPSGRRPIGSELEYDAALEEARRLWGSPIGTPDGDRLDILLESYEVLHYPIASPYPVGQGGGQ